MLEFLKDNWIRIVTAIVSAAIFYTAHRFSGTIVTSSKLFDQFSYYGTVTTAVALLFALSEIVHGVSISKGIRSEAKRIASQSNHLRAASFASECLSALDDTNGFISTKNYSLALKCFQHFRRAHLRMCTDAIRIQNDEIIITNIETAIQGALETSEAAPLGKHQKARIVRDILKLKTSVGQIDPSSGQNNATS